MKKITFAYIIACLLVFSSCKKETVENIVSPNSGLIGYWKGSYDGGVGNWAVVIYNNGTLRFYDLLTSTDTATVPSTRKGGGIYNIQNNNVMFYINHGETNPPNLRFTGTKNGNSITGTLVPDNSPFIIQGTLQKQ